MTQKYKDGANNRSSRLSGVVAHLKKKSGTEVELGREAERLEAEKEELTEQVKEVTEKFEAAETFWNA